MPDVVLYSKSASLKAEASENDNNPILPKKVSLFDRSLEDHKLEIITDQEKSSSENEAQPSVVRPTKRKSKLNPNIQRSIRLEKKQKLDGNTSDSDSDVVTVSYKSNRSAMPQGPQDQGATATLVSHQYYLSI